jgi:Integrase zinc binding domain
MLEMSKWTSLSVVEELQRDNGKDETFKEVYAETGEQFVTIEGLLYDAKGKVCVPDGRLRSVLMHDTHDAIVKGHVGFDKCLQDLQNSFTWPTLRRDMKEYVRACDSCHGISHVLKLPLACYNRLKFLPAASNK